MQAIAVGSGLAFCPFGQKARPDPDRREAAGLREMTGRKSAGHFVSRAPGMGAILQVKVLP
jgi:hypothetical protein